MKTFRTLDLAIEFYDKVENLEIKGHLRDQLVRAASSISLNLAEGNTKPSVKEKKRYYQIAYGSQKECLALFRLIKVEDNELLAKVDHLGACLYKLLKSEMHTIN